jgi:hypothetical protein
MKIIGLNPSKTGSWSLHVALTTLGFRCLNESREMARRCRTLDFEGYDAFIGEPIWQYVDRVLRKYPDAYLIATLRDREATIRSRIIHQLHNRVTGISPWIDTDTRAWERDHDRFERIVQSLDHPRLLRLRITEGEGWEPLCDFLNLPVPDVPFPYENSGVRKLEEILTLYRQQRETA